MNNDNYAVIMAGGVGARFWPVSHKRHPKQFLDLMGCGQTLIQKTYARLSKIVPKANIFILTNNRYEDLVIDQLPEVTDRQIVREPAMRNTAPCILLSALKIHRENPNSSMIVAPSDHWIEDEEAFAADVENAFKQSTRQSSLMTLGIQPTFPNVGYGYIKFDPGEEGMTKKVKKFTEKPDYQTAKEFLAQGNYLWNAGIFIWKTDVIIKAFKTYLPAMYELFDQGKPVLNTAKENAFINQYYEQAENTSIDYGIMEKADRVNVIPASFDWNDLGTWGSLYDRLPKDDQSNVVINAQTHLLDSQENMIYGSKEKVIVIKGLSNHIVVDKDDILLIYPKTEEQDIKAVRKAVREKLGKDLG